MQNAKDSFFLALRDRLAVLNPSRMVLVLGGLRPAVLVAENELPSGEGDPLDCFVITWQGSNADSTEPLPLHALQCTVSYATRGTAAHAGMDRGRVLDAMDGELRSMLSPASAVKQDFTTTPAVTMATQIFWSAPDFAAAALKEDRIARAAKVVVFALQEAGEA